jgi:hypothetical protein
MNHFEHIKMMTQNVTQDLKRLAQQKGFMRKLFGIPLEMVLIEQQKLSIGDSTPRLLTRSIEYIERHLDEVGIYRLSGSTKEVQDLRWKYEQEGDIAFQYEDVNSVCSLVKMFIRELPEPLLTTELSGEFNKVLEPFENQDSAFDDHITLDTKHVLVNNPNILNPLKRLIDRLPLANSHFLAVYLAHLKRVASNYKVNKMGFTNLQVVFAPTLHFGGSLFMVMILHCERLFSQFQTSHMEQIPHHSSFTKARRPSETTLETNHRRTVYTEDAAEVKPRKLSNAGIHVPARSHSKNVLQSSPVKVIAPWQQGASLLFEDTSTNRNYISGSPPKTQISQKNDTNNQILKKLSVPPEPAPSSVSPPPRQHSIGILQFQNTHGEKPAIPARPPTPKHTERGLKHSRSNPHLHEQFKRESTQSISAGVVYPTLQYEPPSNRDSNPFEDPLPPPVPAKDIPVYQIEPVQPISDLPGIQSVSPFPDFQSFPIEEKTEDIPPAKPPRRRKV